MITSLRFWAIVSASLVTAVFSFRPALAIEEAVPTASATPAEKVNAPAESPSAATQEGSIQPVSPADSWTLRYKFHDGQKLRYEMEQNMTMEANLGDRGTNVDRSALRQRRVFSARTVSDGQSAEFTMQFEDVWMQKQVDTNSPIEFSSAMKPADVPPVFQQVAHQLKGVAPRYVLNSRGLSERPQREPKSPESREVKQHDAPLVEGEPAAKAIQLASNKTEVEKEVADPGSFLATLPENEVRVGDSWKELINVSVRLQEEVNVDVPILRTFRLESVENGVAEISFVCSIQSRVRSPIVKGQLIQATPRGKIRLDINRGLMLRRENIYDTSVFGALGHNTILTCVGRSTETLLEELGSSSEKTGNGSP